MQLSEAISASIFVDDEIKSRRPPSYVALRHEDNPELTHVLKGDQVELSRIFRLPLLSCDIATDNSLKEFPSTARYFFNPI